MLKPCYFISTQTDGSKSADGRTQAYGSTSANGSASADGGTSAHGSTSADGNTSADVLKAHQHFLIHVTMGERLHLLGDRCF